MGKLINKKCERCGKELTDVLSITRYCPECKKIILRENQKRCRNNKPRKSAHSEDEYENNLLNLSDNPINLTSIGFNKISKIKVKSYTKYFKMNWIEILKKYNKFNNLYKYVIFEYKKFYTETESQNLHRFCKEHSYINYDLLIIIGIDNIMQDANIRKLRYTDDDYKNNFLQIKEKLSRTPLYNEFLEHSLIPVESYANRYNLKGKVYDKMAKMYLTEEEFNQYKSNQQNHKSKIGKTTGALSVIYSLEDLEEEFKSTFNNYYSDFKDYPSRKIFNKVSKHDDSVYRKRLNLNSWINICKYYGYIIPPKFKFENSLLNAIDDILNEQCIRQKTFKWLKSNKNGHMRLDGYYEKYKLAIEADGQQHYQPVSRFGGENHFKEIIENDKLKNKLVKENGIIMLRIRINENWYDVNYLKKRLKEIGIEIKVIS